MRPSKRESFRLARGPFMIGKRVKPRLRWLAYGSYTVALGVMYLSVVAVFFAMVPIGDVVFTGIHGVWVTVLFIAVALCTFYATLFAFKAVFTRLGWMTQEEARSFPLRKSQWPDSWYEQVDHSTED